MVLFACARDVPPSDTPVIFVAGGPSHGPGEHEYLGGAKLLASLLAQTPGIASMIVEDAWPEDVSVFDRAETIVFLTDGNVLHPLQQDGRMDVLEPLVTGGVGLVAIHWSVHFTEQTERARSWLGGYYRDDFSVNPVWTARFEGIADHPIARGVGAFELSDEWYYNLDFAETTTPILRAVPPEDTRFTEDAMAHPGRAETTSWAFEREGGGRSFGITGAHFHQSWAKEEFRRLVVNAILWTAEREVPPAGAPVALDPATVDDFL